MKGNRPCKPVFREVGDSESAHEQGLRIENSSVEFSQAGSSMNFQSLTGYQWRGNAQAIIFWENRFLKREPGDLWR